MHCAETCLTMLRSHLLCTTSAMSSSTCSRHMWEQWQRGSATAVAPAGAGRQQEAVPEQRRDRGDAGADEHDLRGAGPRGRVPRHRLPLRCAPPAPVSLTFFVFSCSPRQMQQRCCIAPASCRAPTSFLVNPASKPQTRCITTTHPGPRAALHMRRLPARKPVCV